MEQLADKLLEIFALFDLASAVNIPLGKDDWTRVEIIDPAEAAALSLALSFFLQQKGNRAQRRHRQKIPKLISLLPAKESCHGRNL